MESVSRNVLTAKLAAVKWVQSYQASLSVADLTRATGIIKALSNAARLCDVLQRAQERGGRR